QIDVREAGPGVADGGEQRLVTRRVAADLHLEGADAALVGGARGLDAVDELGDRGAGARGAEELVRRQAAALAFEIETGGEAREGGGRGRGAGAFQGRPALGDGVRRVSRQRRGLAFADEIAGIVPEADEEARPVTAQVALDELERRHQDSASVAASAAL